MSEPQGTDVDVDWAVARDANRANWDERAGLHEVAYGIERCAEDPAYLSTVVSDDLPVLAAHLPQGSLRGLDVVHLQCHIGTDPSASPDAPVGPTPRHRVSLLRVGEQ